MYEFNYYVDPLIMTKMTLKSMYKTLVGVVNITFTIGSMSLLFRFWADFELFSKILLFLCVFAFPIFQPLFIYKRLKKQIGNLPKNMKIILDEKNFTISFDNNVNKIKWTNTKRILKDKSIFVIYTSEKEGYILTKEILGSQFENVKNLLETVDCKNKSGFYAL
ncbi:MAG: YcxB family protein [Lachnospirales bacterium]